jgi:hypothetical protein
MNLTSSGGGAPCFVPRGGIPWPTRAHKQVSTATQHPVKTLGLPVSHPSGRRHGSGGLDQTLGIFALRWGEALPLYLLIRGADRTAPLLLWLHGGPGGAERPLFRYFNDDLEKSFVVVGINAAPGVPSTPRRIHTASLLPSISPTSTPSLTILDRAWAKTRSSSWVTLGERRWACCTRMHIQKSYPL